MMAANYRHIGGLENRLGRHDSRFSTSWPAAPLAAQSLARRKLPNHGSNRPSQANAEDDAIQRAVCHAFRLYRLVLNGLGVDPLAGLPEQIHTGTSGDGGVLDGVKLSGEH